MEVLNSSLENEYIRDYESKTQRKAIYYGEKIVLKCQELGLNTCWVAMTHGKSKAEIKRGQKLIFELKNGEVTAKNLGGI